jgi:hypothetical protein
MLPKGDEYLPLASSLAEFKAEFVLLAEAQGPYAVDGKGPWGAGLGEVAEGYRKGILSVKADTRNGVACLSLGQEGAEPITRELRFPSCGAYVQALIETWDESTGKASATAAGEGSAGWNWTYGDRLAVSPYADEILELLAKTPVNTHLESRVDHALRLVLPASPGTCIPWSFPHDLKLIVEDLRGEPASVKPPHLIDAGKFNKSRTFKLLARIIDDVNREGVPVDKFRTVKSLKANLCQKGYVEVARSIKHDPRKHTVTTDIPCGLIIIQASAAKVKRISRP